jgi:uncharacterized protein YwgA
MGKGEVRWLVKFLGTSPKKLAATSAIEDRLRLQKAAFLLNHFGVSPFTNYSFSMYLKGPYSPSLARDYYNLGKTRAARFTLDADHMKTLTWFSSRDTRWLEVASSILSIKERNKGVGKEDVYSVLRLSKPWVDHDYFESVVTELDQKQL